MPTIEIISLRFNLDKDDDRKLFEELQKRSDPGKRNEFIKQILVVSLSAPAPGGKSTAKISKKPNKESAPGTAGPEPSEIKHSSDLQPKPHPGPGASAEPVPQGCIDKDKPRVEGPEAVPDEEASGIASQFMQ